MNSSYLDRSDVEVFSRHETLLPQLSFLILYFGCVTEFMTHETLHKSYELPAEYWLPECVHEVSVLLMFEKKLTILTSLCLHDVNKRECKTIVTAVNSGLFPNQIKFAITMWSLTAKEKMIQVTQLKQTDQNDSIIEVREENIVEHLLPITFKTLTNLSLH